MPAAALGAPQTICSRCVAADVDGAHAQAVGVRMRLDLVDPRDDHVREGRRGGYRLLDLEPGHRQLVAQRLRRQRRIA